MSKILKTIIKKFKKQIKSDTHGDRNSTIVFLFLALV